MESMNTSSLFEQGALGGLQEPKRKIWRIGSVTMGITLIIIGIAFAASLWQEISALDLLMWVTPLVFIMLGTEVLLHLKFVNHERYQVKYDWLSTFFVAIIGCGALMIAGLMSTGIFDEISKSMNMKQRAIFVQEESVVQSEAFDRIIVKTFIPVQIEEHDSLSSIQLTGSVQYESAGQLAETEAQYMHTQSVGSTLYIFVNNLEHNSSGFVHDRIYSKLVLNVPSGKEVIYN